jgi:ferredoxin
VAFEPTNTDSIEVAVDHELCYGAQNCSFAAPGAFSYDEDGKAVVDDPSEVTPEQLAEAEAGCPAMAIRVSGLPQPTGE